MADHEILPVRGIIEGRSVTLAIIRCVCKDMSAVARAASSTAVTMILVRRL